MDEDSEYFLSTMGPHFKKSQPTESQIIEFSGLLPEKLLDYWHEFGRGGFHDGLFWITDPNEFSPAVEAWLEGTKIEDVENYYAIARSAFGRIFLWNKSTGQNITINSLDSVIITTPPDKYVANGDDTKSLQSFFSSTDPEELDIKDFKDNRLFEKALKKLGPVSENEMYGFEPALCLGGMPAIENLVKVKIVPHLILLEQLCEVEILHFDMSRHL